MLTKNERMNKLEAAGIKTSKYFTVDLDNGTKVHLIIDENGDCKQVYKNDEVLNQIIEDGYVKNTKLFRRFVMAQMFAALNYKSYDGRYRGYNDCLKRNYTYDYTFNMMLEEVRVLSKLEERDRESFEERAHFFTKDVVVAVMNDYLVKLQAYIDKLPNKNCKGVPYKKIKGTNIFVADLDKKIYLPIRCKIDKVKYAKNYKAMYTALNGFVANMMRLPWDTPKSKVWLDAFKGNGSFYTMKNLILFHQCKLETENHDIISGSAAMDYLNRMLDKYKGEGWRMFALMKKVIADNNFDFNKKMKEIYNK